MKTLAVFLLGLFLVPCASAADLAKAKQEGKANFYANITAVEPIMKAFRRHRGEGVYTRISTSKYLATVLTEFDAGKLQADVLQGPLPILQTLKDKGVLAPYRSPSAAGYPDWAGRTNHRPVRHRVCCPDLQQRTGQAGRCPKTYEDLTDPKWYDKIVMPDPATHATTISWLVGLKEAKVFPSDEAWMEFVKGLAANKPMFVKSFSPTPAPVESGEKFLAISMPKYIITKAPAPLDWAHVGPLLGTPRGIALRPMRPTRMRQGSSSITGFPKMPCSLLADKVGEYVLAPGVFPPSTESTRPKSCRSENSRMRRSPLGQKI